MFLIDVCLIDFSFVVAIAALVPVLVNALYASYQSEEEKEKLFLAHGNKNPTELRHLLALKTINVIIDL